jgi:hypothetical protein
MDGYGKLAAFDIAEFSARDYPKIIIRKSDYQINIIDKRNTFVYS